MSPSIVTIDDNADLRRLYTLALRGSGFDVVGEAADGARGVATVQERRPDMVLLDLSMPRMDGLETLVELRKLDPGMRIVVLSGFTRDKLQAVVSDLGAVDYIEKGIPPQQLVGRLREAMAIPVPRFKAPTPARVREMQVRMAQLV